MKVPGVAEVGEVFIGVGSHLHQAKDVQESTEFFPFIKHEMNPSKHPKDNE